MRHFFTAFVLIFLLVGSGCEKRAATGIAIDSAFAPWIAPDTKVLAGIRVNDLKVTPFYKRHEKELNIPLLDAFSERAGLDPRRDVSHLLVAWNGKQALAMARGRFTQAEIERKLGSLGARRSSYKKYTLLSRQDKSLVFVKKEVALAGSAEALHAEIDLGETDTGGVPDELKQRLRTVPKNDQLWLVGRRGLPFADAPMGSNIESALSNITEFVSGASLGIGVDTGTHVQMEITCISEQGAERVRDALRGALGLARLATKDNELDLLRLYDSIHVEQDQQAIHVRADLPEDLTDKLLSYLPQLRSRAGQALRNER